MVGSLSYSLVRDIHNVCVCPVQFKDIIYFASVTTNHCVMNDMNEKVIYSYGINKENEINLIQEYIDDNPREVFDVFCMRIDIHLL